MKASIMERGGSTCASAAEGETNHPNTFLSATSPTIESGRVAAAHASLAHTRHHKDDSLLIELY